MDFPWKANKTNIQLYRINNNGSISTKKYKFNINEEVSEDKNPPLKDDIVKVNLTSTSKIRWNQRNYHTFTEFYLLLLIKNNF